MVKHRGPSRILQKHMTTVCKLKSKELFCKTKKDNRQLLHLFENLRSVPIVEEHVVVTPRSAFHGSCHKTRVVPMSCIDGLPIVAICRKIPTVPEVGRLNARELILTCCQSERHCTTPHFHEISRLWSVGSTRPKLLPEEVVHCIDLEVQHLRKLVHVARESLDLARLQVAVHTIHRSRLFRSWLRTELTCEATSSTRLASTRSKLAVVWLTASGC